MSRQLVERASKWHTSANDTHRQTNIRHDLVAGLIFAAALLLSTVINSAEPPPIETHSRAASVNWPTPAAATAKEGFAVVTFSEMRVQQIVEDGVLSIEQKIARLRGYKSEARGLQRAASKSPMNASDGWDDDLRQVRLALDKLGAVEPLKGAASL